MWAPSYQALLSLIVCCWSNCKSPSPSKTRRCCYCVQTDNAWPLLDTQLLAVGVSNLWTRTPLCSKWHDRRFITTTEGVFYPSSKNAAALNQNEPLFSLRLQVSATDGGSILLEFASNSFIFEDNLETSACSSRIAECELIVSWYSANLWRGVRIEAAEQALHCCFLL